MATVSMSITDPSSKLPNKTPDKMKVFVRDFNSAFTSTASWLCQLR